jgi:hypothetical protein
MRTQNVPYRYTRLATGDRGPLVEPDTDREELHSQRSSPKRTGTLLQTSRGKAILVRQGLVAAKAGISQGVALSTCEAEVHGLSEHGQHLLKIRNYLRDFIGGEIDGPSIVHEDNKGPVDYVRNPAITTPDSCSKTETLTFRFLMAAKEWPHAARRSEGLQRPLASYASGEIDLATGQCY